jgi:RHS repeat-associated protein
VIVGLELVADGAGRRRLVAITGAPWSDHAYDYDTLSRLVAAVAGAQHGPLPDPADPAAVDAFLAASPAVPAGDVTDTYTLGDADTRDVWTRTDVAGPVARGYSYDVAHRLTGITTNGATSAVTHDADGRRTADDRWSYRHDVLGRLREVLDAASGASALELEWDALGRLHAIRRPSGEGIVLRHLGECVVERLHTDGSLTQETYGALPREVPLRVDPVSVLFRLQDHRGSTLALVDDSGAAVERHQHEDFGAVTGWDGAGSAPVPLLGLGSPVLFAGLEYLPDVGLYIAGERAYDPDTGLFLAPDPLGALDSANLYLYAKHDPVNLTDVSGRYIESAWDVFSLGVGIASLTYNLTRDKTDWWAVGLDIAGILADTVALILPGVPGGAGALIKASRAARTGAQIVTQTTRAGRAVRYTQAGIGVANAVRGAALSYESAREGRYGAAAFGIGLSALGIRGSLGRIAAVRAAAHVPTSIYTTQGNVADIVRSGRIWGQTEGRVWGTPVLGGGPMRTGKMLRDLPPVGERVIFEFTGETLGVFRPHAVWGPFTAWKAFAGQHITELGDLHVRFTEPTLDAATLALRSTVTHAEHLANQFANPAQSLLRARLWASVPILIDTGIDAFLATAAGLLGLIEAQIRAGGVKLRPPALPTQPNTNK